MPHTVNEHAAASNAEPREDTDTETLSASKPDGRTFAVSDVAPARKLLITNDAQAVFEHKLGKKILFFPGKYKGARLVASANNGLIQTIQESYDQHRPLLLTPDHIWLAICQGASIHINQEFKTLESQIFVKDKPKELVVRNDSLEYSGQSWEMLVASLSEQTRKYTKGDFYAFYVSDFSTTSKVETTAYQVALLESYKKAFAYVGESGCGIPSVTLAGTKKDWETILAKLGTLEKIGLGDWAQSLRPVIREFIAVFDGKVNKPFWQDMYKNLEEYGNLYISGWIIKFFPYLKSLDLKTGVYDENTNESRVEEVFIKNEFIRGDLYLQSTLTTEDFPSGISKIEVKFKNYFRNTTRDIEVYSGFFAIRQYDDKTVQPVIAWAVCDKKGSRPGEKLKYEAPASQKHAMNTWTPHVYQTDKIAPVYDIKRFKTAEESKAYIRKYMLDSIASQKRFMDTRTKGLKIDFTVLSNGKIAGLRFLDASEPDLQAYLEKLLQRLPKPWFPAVAPVSDVMEDFPEERKDQKIKVNSHVTIEL